MSTHITDLPEQEQHMSDIEAELAYRIAERDEALAEVRRLRDRLQTIDELRAEERAQFPERYEFEEPSK